MGGDAFVLEDSQLNNQEVEKHPQNITFSFSVGVNNPQLPMVNGLCAAPQKVLLRNCPKVAFCTINRLKESSVEFLFVAKYQY